MGESTETKVFSLEEVKKHVKGGSEKDIWIVIHDNVYDVTKFGLLKQVTDFHRFDNIRNEILRNAYIKGRIDFEMLFKNSKVQKFKAQIQMK